METIKHLNVKHLSEAVARIQENNKAIFWAEIKKDKNALLKLRFTAKTLMLTFKYWRTKVDEDLAEAALSRMVLSC